MRVIIEAAHLPTWFYLRRRVVGGPNACGLRAADIIQVFSRKSPRPRILGTEDGGCGWERSSGIMDVAALRPSLMSMHVGVMAESGAADPPAAEEEHAARSGSSMALKAASRSLRRVFFAAFFLRAAAVASVVAFSS